MPLSQLQPCWNRKWEWHSWTFERTCRIKHVTSSSCHPVLKATYCIWKGRGAALKLAQAGPCLPVQLSEFQKILTGEENPQPLWLPTPRLERHPLLIQDLGQEHYLLVPPPPWSPFKLSWGALCVLELPMGKGSKQLRGFPSPPQVPLLFWLL